MQLERTPSSSSSCLLTTYRYLDSADFVHSMEMKMTTNYIFLNSPNFVYSMNSNSLTGLARITRLSSLSPDLRVLFVRLTFVLSPGHERTVFVEHRFFKCATRRWQQVGNSFHRCFCCVSWIISESATNVRD